MLRRADAENANLEAAQASRADGMLGEKMGKKKSL
jgi:hypothetical protein